MFDRCQLLLIFLIASLCIVLSAAPSLASEPITLQLNWCNPAQVAGYYAALKKGFYAQEGLDVRIKTAGRDTNSEPSPTDMRPIAIGTLIALAVAIIALYIFSLNRRLNQKMTELNVALKELAESEERYRLLTENATDVIWTIDLQGRFTYVSPSVQRLRGYTVEEVMAQPVEQALTERSRHHYIEGMKMIAEIVQQGGRFEGGTYEIEHPCKDGSTVWTELITSGIYDGEGRLTGIVGVTRNISQRREAEKRLRLLYDAVGQMPLGVVIADMKGSIGYVNNGFIRMTGINMGGLSTLNYRSLINFIGEAIDDKTWERIEAGSLWQGERHCKDSLGKGYWESCIITPVRDDAGNIAHFVSTHMDITERKDLEIKVKGLLQTIESIGDHLPNSFIYQIVKTYPEIQRKFTYISKGISDVIGIKPEEALGDPNKLYGMIHPEYEELFLRVEKETIENRRDAMSLDLRGYNRSGDLRWLRLQASYRYHEDGKTATVDGIVTDITYHKTIELEIDKARQEAILASKAKGEFLSHMSHEIRTPLHSIIGYTELLSYMDLPMEAKDYIKNMKSAESALLCLINDILDFSKIESGKMRLFVEEIDLLMLLEQTIDIICLQACHKGLELIFDIDPRLPRFVHTDAVRLRQVLINFLSNAVKFTERGEIGLRVRFEETDDSRGIFHFSVRDTGIGISEEYQEKIFNSFMQVNSEATRQHGGTGLGLAISERLVSLMGGHIKLESKLSEGSEFSFAIAARYRRGKLQIPSLPAMKALVVYKNDTVRRYLKELLDLSGIYSMDSDNDSDAMDMAISCPDIDILLVDYKIFSERGLDRLREIIHHLQKTHTDLKIILILEPTALIDSRYAPVWLNNVVQLYKPVKFRMLYELFQAPIRDTVKASDSALALADAVKILIAEDVPMNMVIVEKLIKKITPNAHILKATNGREAVELYMSKFPNIVLMDVQMPEMDGVSATRIIREKEAALQRRSTIIALTASNTESERQCCMGAGMDHFLSKPIDMRALKEIFTRSQKKDSSAPQL